jgi:uncharacterized protein
MKKQRYQLSQNIRIISDSESKAAMVYHSLYGNPRIVNDESLRFLDLFRQPTTAEKICEICDEDPRETIKEFAKIFFLVEPSFNEKKFLRQQKTRHLLKVSKGQTIDRIGLAISDSCNFGCTHCIHFQPSNNNGVMLPIYQKPVKQLNMSWETAKKCIDRYVVLMREQGRNLCKIHFGNAEPLVNWSVIEKILRYCTDMKDLTFEFAINTNLVLMTRKIAEALKRYRVRIATSLDGTSQANDAIRISKKGKGTFDRIVEKFNLLAEIDYQLDGFSITVTSGNFELIDTDIIDLAAKRRMTSIAFDYDLVSLTDIPVATRVDKLMRLKRYANERGINFFGTWDSAFLNLTSESLLTGNHAFCAAVEGKSLEFNVDGGIKVCSHTTTQVGNIDIFDQMFQETGGLFKMVKERFPGTDEYCSRCAIEGLCGGQCHVTREAIARSVKREKQQRFFADMCDFYRVVTNALAIEYIRSNRTVMVDNRQTCTL